MNNLNSPRETNYEAFDLSDVDSRLADLANRVWLEEQGMTSILPDQIPYQVIATQIGVLWDQVDSIFDITDLDIATETMALLYADPYITDRFQVLKEYLSQLSSLENQPEIIASLSTTNNAKNDRELIANTIPLLQEMLEDESISQTEKYEIFVIYKYLELFLKELELARAKYTVQAYLDAAESDIWSHINIEESEKTRNDAIKYYNDEFKKIDSYIKDIKIEVSNIIIQEEKLKNKATQDIQNKVNKEKNKSKIGRIIDIIFDKRPSPEDLEKELDELWDEHNTQKEQLRKLQNTRESLYKLRDMYEEYAKHMWKVSKDGIVDFGDRIKGIKKKIEDMSADDVIDVIVTDVVEEATKMWGHPPADREQFKKDIKKWYETVSSAYDVAQETDDNFTIFDKIRTLPKEHVRGLVKILINPKNWVFDSKTDLGWEITKYNGKKYVRLSTRALEYSGKKWLNAISGIKIPLEEFEDDVLWAMDYNEKEAFLVAMYRQSRFIGRWWAGAASLLFHGASAIVKDPRPGGRISRAAIKTFFGKNQNMTNDLTDYLKLASRHLSDTNSMGNQKTIAEITKMMNNHVNDTILSTWVLERVSKNNTIKFTNAQTAKASLHQYLYQAKYTQYINISTIDEYIDTIWKKAFPYDKKFTNNTRKKTLWDGIKSKIDLNLKALNDELYQWKNKLFSKILDKAPLLSVRHDVSRMNQALSQAGKYIGDMVSMHSSEIVSPKALWVITKARLASAVSRVTKVWREWTARIWNVTDLKHHVANFDIVLRHAPHLIGGIMRSAPVLSLPAQRKEDRERYSNVSHLAAMLVPIAWPLWIMNDATGEWNFKSGELAVGAFFFWADVLMFTNMALKSVPMWGTRQPLLKSIVKRSADPILATIELPKLITGNAITTSKVIRDAKKVGNTVIPDGKWGIKKAGARARLKPIGRLGITWLIGGLAYRGLKEYGDSIDTDITNKYAKLLDDMRTSNISEKEKYQKMQEYYDEKREHIKINNATKKYMLQLQSSYFVQNYEWSRDELRDPTTIGVSKKPDFIRFDISNNGTINVFLNKIIPYTSYAKFSEAFREHIQWLLPDGSTWKFKEGTNSFLYGKEIFEEIISETRWEFDHTVDPLQQFQKDMQLGDVQQKKGKVIQRRNYIEKALDRRGIWTWYTQERLHSWTKRYADNHIKGKKK